MVFMAQARILLRFPAQGVLLSSVATASASLISSLGIQMLLDVGIDLRYHFRVFAISLQIARVVEAKGWGKCGSVEGEAVETERGVCKSFFLKIAHYSPNTPIIVGACEKNNQVGLQDA